MVFLMFIGNLRWQILFDKVVKNIGLNACISFKTS